MLEVTSLSVLNLVFINISHNIYNLYIIYFFNEYKMITIKSITVFGYYCSKRTRGIKLKFV